MLYRVLWMFTGAVSSYLVEDVEDGIDAVDMPLTAWGVTAVSLFGAFSASSPASTLLLAQAVMFASIAALWTAGSAWYFARIYGHQVEVTA